jgi:hypothetical protein
MIDVTLIESLGRPSPMAFKGHLAVALTSTKLKNLDDLFIFIVMSDVFFDKFL